MMVYTSGDWYVKRGREDEFVRAWKNFAQWTVDEVDHTGQGTLLRDQSDPSHFISFGSWKDAETVERWRASEDFQRNISGIRELTESMKIANFEVAAQTELLTAAAR